MLFVQVDEIQNEIHVLTFLLFLKLFTITGNLYLTQSTMTFQFLKKKMLYLAFIHRNL